MAKIEFVVPEVRATRFSGGLLCIFEYANGLADLGHEVHITPIYRSERPEWFSPRFTLNLGMQAKPTPVRLRQIGLALLACRSVAGAKMQIRAVLGGTSRLISSWSGFSFRFAGGMESYRRNRIAAEITIATGNETALAVHAYATGQQFYFAQHYEPYFAIDSDDPQAAETVALASYGLGLKQIVNSSWLKSTITERHRTEDVEVCVNAIDHQVFFVDDGIAKHETFTVISYGGRRATWKGFAEMVEAIHLARRVIPDLRWEVFGDASAPPDNLRAPYTALGFISGKALRDAYNRAHVLMSFSWYESFPLFPLEAMACGCTVITTPYGTEDYAVDGRNALTVRPRQPQDMADAIVALYRDRTLWSRLRIQGIEDARHLTWKSSVLRMNDILTRPSS